MGARDVADRDRTLKLDDRATRARIDVHGVAETLLGFARQCRMAASLRPVPDTPLTRPRAVVIAGMGGSAAGGDLLATCAAERLDIPVLVHRGYGLPALVGSRDLVIVTSYSGETAEALSAFEAALERGAAVAVVTSGGRLDALARQRQLPRVEVPTGLMPRYALGYLFFSLLALLRAADLVPVKDAEVEEALLVLEQLGPELGPDRPAAANEAKRLALALEDRMPVIYGGPLTAAVAYRWKTDLEENAKTFAAAGALPETNHNEIEACGGPSASRLHLVQLRDEGEPPDITRRFAVLGELVGGSLGGASQVWTRGTSSLARLLSVLALGQWTSFYLALLRGVDPWSVPLLEALKAHLGRPD
ncbi:MAG TPA: bifunctional phosphoglucose/phosphomannose isomerase [Methylomirabilota bacterium]|jgi:glucose/mannose-6-phosphate isomerase